MSTMRHAFASGYENLSAWSDLLDRINVFPVADGDTGANLRISLAPLRDYEADKLQTLELLTRCATGNSSTCHYATPSRSRCNCRYSCRRTAPGTPGRCIT